MFKHVSALVAVVGLLAAAPAAHAQGGPLVNVEITPEQQSYQSRTDARIREWIHEENHDTTDEERHFVDEHWRRAAKLWRIRHLANAAHDMGTVARVDRLLARADMILEHQLARMRAHAPIMTIAPGTADIAQAPPPPQVEVQGAAPPGQTWVPGYWHWNGSRHVWIRGRWAAPPQVGMTYEAPKWESRGGRWYFHEGRWAAPSASPTGCDDPPPPPPTVVEVQAPPPPPLVEVRPPAPRGSVWIPGYWHWNGNRHVWISGRWSAARRGERWEPDHWVRTGRGYRLERGHWTR